MAGRRYPCMREILTDLDRWTLRGEQVAVATLVAVRGSAPRLPGARLALARGGEMAGSVSGGCVESDVFERAIAVLDRGRPEIATYGIADELAFSVGLSCGASIDVLIEPFVASDEWQAVRRAVEGRRAATLAIGLSPDTLLGCKVAVPDDGPVVGSIDPALDEDVIAAARRLLPAGGTRVLALRYRGGEGRVFVEAFPPPLRLFIVGATHTATALARLAKGLGFHVTVVDARGLYATRARFPEADEVLVASPGEILDAAALDAYCYVVILTHDRKFDVGALEPTLRSGACYVGMLGSRATQAERTRQLREMGFGDVDVARIRGPIGLDIGSRTPEEIALAICAEMLAVRSGRDGRPLSERRGP